MNTMFWVVLVLMSVAAVASITLPFALHPSIARHRKIVSSIVPALLLTAFSIGLYSLLGSPEVAVADNVSNPRQSNPASPGGKQVGSVDSMVDGLVEKLAKNPDDGSGWLLLAKSYRHLDRPVESRDAYSKAKALGRSDADLESFLSNQVAEHSTPVLITGKVSIAKDRSLEINDSATVFIIAKAVNGSPVPLAVIRTTVASLPYEFTLSDENSMVAGNELSKAQQVIITAKISPDGDALNAIPGLEVHSEPVSTSNPKPVALEFRP